MGFQAVVQFLALTLSQFKRFGSGCNGIPNILDKLNALRDAELLDALQIRCLHAINLAFFAPIFKFFPWHFGPNRANARKPYTQRNLGLTQQLLRRPFACPQLAARGLLAHQGATMDGKLKRILSQREFSPFAARLSGEGHKSFGAGGS